MLATIVARTICGLIGSGVYRRRAAAKDVEPTLFNSFHNRAPGKIEAALLRKTEDPPTNRSAVQILRGAKYRRCYARIPPRDANRQWRRAGKERACTLIATALRSSAQSDCEGKTPMSASAHKAHQPARRRARSTFRRRLERPQAPRPRRAHGRPESARICMSNTEAAKSAMSWATSPSIVIAVGRLAVRRPV